MNDKLKPCPFLIDKEDVERVSKYNWKLYDRYYEAWIDGKTVKLSRFIMTASNNMYVDHINGNIKDNRKQNLRLCSNGENQQNRKLNKNNMCGHKGIQLMSNGKYRVRVQSNNERKHLGVFDNIEEAIKIRRDYAKEKHGQFYRER